MEKALTLILVAMLPLAAYAAFADDAVMDVYPNTVFVMKSANCRVEKDYAGQSKRSC